MRETARRTELTDAQHTLRRARPSSRWRKSLAPARLPTRARQRPSLPPPTPPREYRRRRTLLRPKQPTHSLSTGVGALSRRLEPTSAHLGPASTARTQAATGRPTLAPVPSPCDDTATASNQRSTAPVRPLLAPVAATKPPKLLPNSKPVQISERGLPGALPWVAGGISMGPPGALPAPRFPT